MAPKSKEPAKAKTSTLKDGPPLDEIPQEQLEEHCVRFRERLESMEGNYFQLKRDNIHRFCKITERQLAEVDADGRNSDKEIEDNERCHQVEIKVHKQKMKFFLHERQNTISEQKAEGLASIEAAQKEKADYEKEIHKGIGSVKVEMQELDIENIIKEIELRNDGEMTKESKSKEVHLTETIRGEFEKLASSWQHGLVHTRITVTIERKAFWNNYFSALMNNQDFFSRDVRVRANSDNKEEMNRRNICFFMQRGNEDSPEEVAQEYLAFQGLTEYFSVIEKNNEDLENELMEKLKDSMKEEDISGKYRAKDPADGKRDLEPLQKKFSECQL